MSATVSSTAAPTAVAEAPEGARRARAAGSVAAGEDRTKVHWYWRLLAWVVAVPLGFVVTAWPAYKLELISKDDVLNVFVGSGTGRYARLAVGTALWALVTALLVQLFVEGGRWWARRRRARTATPSGRETTRVPASARR